MVKFFQQATTQHDGNVVLEDMFFTDDFLASAGFTVTRHATDEDKIKNAEQWVEYQASLPTPEPASE